MTSEAADLVARIQTGGSVDFGAHVTLRQNTLEIGHQRLRLNTLKTVQRRADGQIAIWQIGAKQVTTLLGQTAVPDVELFVSVVNTLIATIPPAKRRTADGFIPGSIGDVSARIGHDVRELRMLGFSHDDIARVERGEISVQDLLRRRS